MKELLIGLIIIINGLYGLFCLFLTAVSLPKDKHRGGRFYFTEEPTGFVKLSRNIGFFILWAIITLVALVIAYGIGDEIL